jgi:hypothetical protein
MNEKFKNQKNKIVKSCFCLLLEVVNVFEVLKFTTTQLQNVRLRNYKK